MELKQRAIHDNNRGNMTLIEAISMILTEIDKLWS